VTMALPLDVEDPASIQTAVDAVMARFGLIDALEERPDELMEQAFAVNVCGPARPVCPGSHGPERWYDAIIRRMLARAVRQDFPPT